MSKQFDTYFNEKTQILGCLVIVLLLLSSWVVSPITASAQEFQDPDSSFNQSAAIASANASGTPPSVTTKSDKGTAGPIGIGKALGLSSYRLTIFNMLSFLGSAIAWLGGSLLDASIGLFTVNMKATAHYFGLDLAIDAMWSIVRDLFNLLFIFGLIWIGFQLILGINESDAKKTLGLLVVAALLINFSLFVAQVVVDFGNVAAVQIHELMRPERTTKLLGFEISNISDSFTSLTGFDRLNGSEGKQSISKAGFNTKEVDTIGNAFVLGLLFLVFYSMLGFIFAAGAILLFTRFVALIVLMIFSPMLFLGFVLPAFGSFGKTWWHYFFNQVLIAPAFLFMLYLSLRALQGMTRMQEFTLIGFTLYLMIVSAFLIASLMIAKSLGAFGASQVMSIGKNTSTKIRGYAGAAAGGATLGLAAAGLRATVGRKAQERAESDGLKQRQSAGGLRGWLARREMGLMRAAGDSSFDARQVGGVGEKLGVGTGHVGGYKTRTEELIKREKEYAESLGIVPEDDAQVVKLQTEVDATEASIKTKKKNVRQLQKDKKATTDEDEQRRIQAEIDDIKAELEKDQEDINKQKEAVQRERYRYQMGSQSQIAEVARGFLKLQKEALETDLAAYADARRDNNKNLQDQLREKIAKRQVRIAEIEKAQNKVFRGYAIEVEELSPVINFFLSRDSEQNKEAGKKIRDEYKSKIKGK